MAEVTAFTATRSQQIEDNAVVSGSIVGDDLILTTHGGANINAGNVRGPQGDTGPIGEVSTAQMDAAIAAANLAQVIGTNNIDDLAVTTEKIAHLAVTAAKLADGSVTEIKLGSGSVTTAKLGNGAVTTDKLGNSAVTTDKIGNDQVTQAKMADGAIGTTQLATDAITQSKIANDAVRPEHVNFIFVQSSTPTGVTGGIWIDT